MTPVMVPLHDAIVIALLLSLVVGVLCSLQGRRAGRQAAREFLPVPSNVTILDAPYDQEQDAA